MPEQQQGYTLGRTALRQLEEVVRKVLGGYVNAGWNSRPRPIANELIEFVLGEAIGSSSDPLTFTTLEFARVFVYGRDSTGDGVYLRQQYVYNPFTGVSGEANQYGTAAFINGRWMIQTLDCDPIAGFEAPEALDELLPDRPSGA